MKDNENGLWRFDPKKHVIHADQIETKVVENDQWKNLHSKSWCPIPFNTISWHPSGHISRCMMSDDNMGTHYDSEHMQRLRRDMLAGKWDTYGCTSCLNKEKKGYRSQRMSWLRNDKIKHLGNPEPYRNPKLTGNQISHLFINFSNVCNFKCRMCSANFSNSLIPENKHMLEKFPLEYKKVPLQNQKNFNDIIGYLEKNLDILPGIKSIWMTGGEPFMTDDPYKLIDLIVEHGKPEELDIVITTNGSKLDFEKLEKFNKVKKLTLDLSIDAVGPLFEYMRSNKVFTWSQMEDTCKKLFEYKKINKEWFNFFINSSYQIFNYDNLLEFYDFIYDHQCESNVRMLMFPEHFRVGNLPDKLKDEARAMCDKVELRYGNRNVHKINILKDIRTALDIKEPYLHRTLRVVPEQDKFRGVYLYDYHDKLADLIYGPKQLCLF